LKRLVRFMTNQKHRLLAAALVNRKRPVVTVWTGRQ
jgi:hypothetical protein